MPVVLRSNANGFPRTRLKRAVEAAMRRLGVGRAELSICVVREREMRAANRRFFGRRGHTDVISISQIEGAALPSRELLLGDVIVSIDAARIQAKEEGHSLLREMSILAVHGLLHNLGMDDRTQAGRCKMMRKTFRLLR